MGTKRTESSKAGKREITRGGGAAQAAPTGNRARIIEASLELFNEHGAHAVSTNHIAAYLSISPGNLYYHFANRNEIIRAIFPHAAEAVRASLPVSPDMEITAEDVGRYHLIGIETLWRFRFLFRDIDKDISGDPVLGQARMELQRWLNSQFNVLLERLILQGQMRRPADPDDLPRIATNAYILWMSWIRYVTESRCKIDVGYADIAEGALHGFLCFSPYLKPAFAEQVRKTFDARARQDASAVAGPARQDARAGAVTGQQGRTPATKAPVTRR